MILTFNHSGKKALANGASMTALFSIPARDRIGRAKDVPQAEYETIFADIISEIQAQISGLTQAGGEAL